VLRCALAVQMEHQAVTSSNVADGDSEQSRVWCLRQYL